MCSISTLWEHKAEFCKVAASDTCMLMIELDLSYLQWLLNIHGYFTVYKFGTLSCLQPFWAVFIWPLAGNNLEIYNAKTWHTILNTVISLNKTSKILFIVCLDAFICRHTSPSNGEIYFSALFFDTRSMCIARCPQDAQCTAGLRCEWMSAQYTREKYCDMQLIFGISSGRVVNWGAGLCPTFFWSTSWR